MSKEKLIECFGCNKEFESKELGLRLVKPCGFICNDCAKILNNFIEITNKNEK